MIQIISGNKDMEAIQRILARSQIDSKEVLERVDEILEEVRIDGDKALVKFTLLKK